MPQQDRKPSASEEWLKQLIGRPLGLPLFESFSLLVFGAVLFVVLLLPVIDWVRQLVR